MIIAGVDEAGRGPLAGPVVCAAVILPPDDTLRGLDDSKKLSEPRREALYAAIVAEALAYRIISVDAGTIDRLNILQATLSGMRQAVLGLPMAPDMVLIDGNRLPDDLPCPARAIVRGDASERAIMAASVLAKVSRDRAMRRLHELHPHYGFDRHKGYPSRAHLQALREFGACPEHRRSYAPVRRALLAQNG